MGYRVGHVKRGSVRGVRRHRRNQRIVAIFAVPLLIGFVVVWSFAQDKPRDKDKDTDKDTDKDRDKDTDTDTGGSGGKSTLQVKTRRGPSVGDLESADKAFREMLERFEAKEPGNESV